MDGQDMWGALDSAGSGLQGTEPCSPLGVNGHDLDGPRPVDGA